MLVLLDSLCAPTHTAAAGATPTPQHVAAALASGTLLSAGALSLLPAPANVVAPSALGPAMSARRRTRTASLTATAAPLNGVLAPTTVVVEFAAALAVRLADVCNNNSLARGGVDFFICLANNLLTDNALLQQWARAVPFALPAGSRSPRSLLPCTASLCGSLLARLSRRGCGATRRQRLGRLSLFELLCALAHRRPLLSAAALHRPPPAPPLLPRRRRRLPVPHLQRAPLPL
jgi:hypothetical protein